jgi:hydrogenase-4 transcriptional activator
VSDVVDIPLQLWREISRHPEIGSALGKLMPYLRAEMPVASVFVRRLDGERRLLETVGEEHVDAQSFVAQSQQKYTDAQFELVLDWSREARVLHGHASRTALLSALVPRGVLGDVIVGPLVDEEGPQGVFVLVAEDSFSELHVRKAQALLEPLRLALENDRRFHELARLREAVEADNRALRSRLERQDIVETIVGGDSGLREVTERIDQVAVTGAPVLVLGETGTGKEVVARAIHARSQRAKGPIVCVNCGAIPPGLVDSELFGHERGSFTGASGTRKGWFERADGGTLFLDEVGELPLDAQVRLLRVLQEHAFERVGGTRSIHVDVRVVAATHRKLEDMVQAGTFREDLWYRMSVFPIYLPPLRDRQSDIPALAAHFAFRAGKRLGGTPLVPSDQDVELLLQYDWPGNVRELVTVIERAAILGGGKRLNVAAALGVRAQPSRPSAPPPPTTVALEAPRRAAAEEPRFLTLDQAMARHIENALEATRGRIEGKGGAAALLDINPHTLRSRMKKLGLDWNRFRG